MLGVNLRQPGCIGDVADDRHQIQRGVSLAQLHMDEVEIALRLIQENQPGRAERRYLPGQLGADRARRSGQQDHTVAEVGRHRR